MLVSVEHISDCRKTADESDGTEEEKFFTSEAIDHGHGDKSSNKICGSHSYGLHITGYLCCSCERKDVVEIVEDRVDTRKLGEHAYRERQNHGTSILTRSQRFGFSLPFLA